MSVAGGVERVLTMSTRANWLTALAVILLGWPTLAANAEMRSVLVIAVLSHVIAFA